MFATKKELEAIDKRLEREALIMYDQLAKIIDQIKEFQSQVNEVLKVTVKPNDLTVYNLSSGLSAESSVLETKLTSEMTDGAKKRMKAYREERNARLGEMEALQAVLNKEAEVAVDEIRKRYGVN